MHLSPKKQKISVCARRSPLSQMQVKEIQSALQKTNPHVHFDTTFVETTGDLDQSTSLRTLDKTDFFTKELDQMILSKECQVAIHSAKDLPDPLPAGIALIALTKGVDSSDSLILREGVSLDQLLPGAKIGTSSYRREEMVASLRSDLSFVDIRGTIEKRLEKLFQGEVDGVVIAEAALIRLNLTHLNRITLPGKTVPGQGQLAILAKSDNNELKTLFSSLDAR